SCCFPPTSTVLTHTLSTAISSLSLHDALPISRQPQVLGQRTAQWQVSRPVCIGQEFGRRLAPAPPLQPGPHRAREQRHVGHAWQDRKSTRLNSSHVKISYAVFCLKKKKKNRSY